MEPGDILSIEFTNLNKNNSNNNVVKKVMLNDSSNKYESFDSSTEFNQRIFHPILYLTSLFPQYNTPGNVLSSTSNFNIISSIPNILNFFESSKTHDSKSSLINSMSSIDNTPLYFKNNSYFIDQYEIENNIWRYYDKSEFTVSPKSASYDEDVHLRVCDVYINFNENSVNDVSSSTSFQLNLISHLSNKRLSFDFNIYNEVTFFYIIIIIIFIKNIITTTTTTSAD
jgi:hypothetical protein